MAPQTSLLALRPVRVLLRRRLGSSIRHSSTDAPLIIQRDVPAPHCGSIRILALNNPKTRNAISRALLAELGKHITDVHEEGPQGPTRAVILTSAIDASFCAGADLKERATFSRSDTDAFLATLRSTFSALAALPIPSISALAATALGGGLELALCTHLRVFAATATVALPESRLGIVPGAGGSYRLPALVGRTRALEMMLTGRRVGAAEAYFIGLCDRLVEMAPDVHGAAASAVDGERVLLAEARDRALQGAVLLAREICEGGPVATRMLIEAVLGDEGVGSAEERENRAYEGVLGTRDRNEALAAFREKRKPVFRGE